MRQGLDLDPARTNPNGGAIITVKCLYELIRTGKRYGRITMRIGGGQGIARQKASSLIP